jgi:hypothetical protein
VGFLVGLGIYLIYLVGPYGVWGSERYINFLRSLPRATRYPAILVLAAYVFGYQFLLKWHFHARYFYGSSPPEYRRATGTYTIFLFAGGCFAFLMIWLRERTKPRRRVENNVTENPTDRR